MKAGCAQAAWPRAADCPLGSFLPARVPRRQNSPVKSLSAPIGVLLIAFKRAVTRIAARAGVFSRLLSAPAQSGGSGTVIHRRLDNIQYMALTSSCTFSAVICCVDSKHAGCWGESKAVCTHTRHSGALAADIMLKSHTGKRNKMQGAHGTGIAHSSVSTVCPEPQRFLQLFFLLPRLLITQVCWSVDSNTRLLAHTVWGSSSWPPAAP